MQVHLIVRSVVILKLIKMVEKLSFDDWREENNGELQDIYIEMCKDMYKEYLNETKRK